MKILLNSILAILIVSCTASVGQEVLKPTDFDQQIKAKDNYQLVDVRTTGEYDSGHLSTSVNFNINDDDFKENLESMDKNKPLFLYCGSGVRSGRAAKIAMELGFKEVFDLKGGIGAWKQAGLPVEK